MHVLYVETRKLHAFFHLHDYCEQPKTNTTTGLQYSLMSMFKQGFFFVNVRVSISMTSLSLIMFDTLNIYHDDLYDDSQIEARELQLWRDR